MKKTAKIFLIIFLLSFSIFPSFSFAAGSSEKNITNFVFTSLNPVVVGVIDNTSIILDLPHGTDVTALAPTIITSAKATVNPKSGVAQNFTDPKTYTVTAEDGSTQDYTVTVFVLNSVPPSMSVEMKDLTQTSVTFFATGFPHNKNITFTVNNYNSDTPSYSQSKQYTTDDTGLALFQFSGLSPNGHYQYYHSEAPDDMGSFWTYAPDNGGNGNQTNLSTEGGGLVPACPSGGCGFTELIDMINKIINFILTRLAVPIAAIMFAYAGFLLVTSGGESSKRTKAKSIFINVAIGLIFIAACWIIIHTVLSILGYDQSWDTWFGF